jgi:hypothetical protein
MEGEDNIPSPIDDVREQQEEDNDVEMRETDEPPPRLMITKMVSSSFWPTALVMYLDNTR